jgi:hypothetical protein
MIFNGDGFRFVALALMIAGWLFLALVVFATWLTATASRQPPTDKESRRTRRRKGEPNV